jgi:hypothetical protein
MPDNSDPISDYIAYAANQRGIDPATALRVAQSEGLNSYTGDSGSSFGPFQLHYGGVAGGGNSVNGLGDDFTKATGLDARDPATIKQQIDFALDHASQNGWGAFHGAAKSGISAYDGIKMSSGAPVPDYLADWGKPAPAAGPAVPNAAPDVPDYLSAWGAAAPGPATAAASGPMTLGIDAKGNAALVPKTPNANVPRDVPRIENWQDVKDAAAQAGAYAKEQLGGVPAAIGQNFTASNALAAGGVQDLSKGNILPSFPSIDPQTWNAGGALKYAAGAAGQLTSPITGAVQKIVEEPATEATGNPAFGRNLGFAANSLALPMLARGAGMAGNALGNATIGTLDPETAQLAALARDKYGINVTAPQVSPSFPLKITSSTLNRLPFSGASASLDAQSNAFQTGIASTIGENANRLTPDVMNSANQRIGNAFDMVANNTTIKADPIFQNKFLDSLIDATHELSPDELKPLHNIFDNIIDKIDPQGNIDGQTYQALTRGKTPLGRAIANPNPNISYYAQQIKDNLDDALQRSAPPEMQDLLTTARGQWRNLKTIEPLAAKAPGGAISPALLSNAINSNPFSKNALAYGRGGDLGELAQIGQRFLKEPGSSMTTERATSTALTGAAGGLGGAMIGLHGLPPEALYALSAIPAGRIMGSALRSPSLANALINRSINPAYRPGLSPALTAISGAGGLAALQKPVNALTPPNQ